MTKAKHAHDFSKHLFRCSSLGKIMTEHKDNITEKQKETIKWLEGKKETQEKGITDKQQQELDRLLYKLNNPQLSETCINHLVEIYVEVVYGRKKDITTKYMEKGLTAEEDAITLYSRVKKRMFKKNDKRVKNEWIIGEPDLFVGEILMEAEEIVDTKASWDLHTFIANHVKKANKSYFWQTQGYCWLTDAQRATVAYCLVNTPDKLIEDEKRKLMYRIGEDHEDFSAACKAIEKEMRFDDIPKEKRVIEISTPFDAETPVKLKERITECRNFLNQMDL